MHTIQELISLGTAGINYEPEALRRDLLAYGEPEVAAGISLMTLQQLAQIKALAPHRLPESGLISRAVCVAAVEVFEGAGRPLRRKRRVYQKPAETYSQ